MELSNYLARQLLEAAPDPSIVIDADGIVCYVNSRIKQVLGYTPEELLGRPVEVLLPERYRKPHVAHRAHYFDLPRSRPMGSDLELYALSKHGREIPVEISLSPVATQQGLLVSAAIRDVTARKELERLLVEANQAKSRFLATASHDLRQPVQALHLLNATARRIVDDQVHKEIIDRQQKALDSISSLLNVLLSISALEAGTVKPELADFPVQDIFEVMRAEFEDQAQAKGLNLIIDSCDEVARSDPSLLSEILANLVSNALSYTRKGFVHLRCLHESLAIRLEVADTGLGIPSDELDKIFSEFYQVDAGTARPEGLGLGLSIVKRMARLLGHPLEVRSKPGEGSVFAITIPRGTEKNLATGVGELTKSPTTSGGLILIVDDEKAVSDAASMLLELEGFEVLTATCEREALSLLSGRTPDLVITDYHLRNEETGIDVLRSIRDQSGTKIPAIVVSGDMSKASLLSGPESTTFLTKPADVEALLAEIHGHLTRGKGPS